MILVFADFMSLILKNIFTNYMHIISVLAASVVILFSPVLMLIFDIIYCQWNRIKFCKPKREKRKSYFQNFWPFGKQTTFFTSIT
jgi:hypothetical protein